MHATVEELLEAMLSVQSRGYVRSREAVIVESE
jgi:hypothetical protein